MGLGGLVSVVLLRHQRPYLPTVSMPILRVGLQRRLQLRAPRMFGSGEVDVSMRAAEMLPVCVSCVCVCLCPSVGPCRKMPGIGQQSGLQQSGITIKDIDAHEFVKRYAIHLKKQGKIALPELVDLMKTSVSRELAPYDDDWFYIRCGESLLCLAKPPQRLQCTRRQRLKCFRPSEHSGSPFPYVWLTFLSPQRPLPAGFMCARALVSAPSRRFTAPRRGGVPFPATSAVRPGESSATALSSCRRCVICEHARPFHDDSLPLHSCSLLFGVELGSVVIWWKAAKRVCFMCVCVRGRGGGRRIPQGSKGSVGIREVLRAALVPVRRMGIRRW